MSETAIILDDHEVLVLLSCQSRWGGIGFVSEPIRMWDVAISPETAAAVERLMSLDLIERVYGGYGDPYRITSAGRDWLDGWMWWQGYDHEPVGNPPLAVVEAVGSAMAASYEATRQDPLDYDYPADLTIRRWPEGGGETEFSPGPWARAMAGHVEAIIQHEVTRRLAKREAA